MYHAFAASSCEHVPVYLSAIKITWAESAALLSYEACTVTASLDDTFAVRTGVHDSTDKYLGDCSDNRGAEG